MNTENIKVYDLSLFEAKLAQLNKRLVKNGLEPVTYTLGEEVKELDTYQYGGETFVEKDLSGNCRYVFSYYPAEVSFADLSLPGGWRLAGVIDHKENLVRSVPGNELSLVAFVERGPVCDHCQVQRYRTETFVLVNASGEVKQIGRQCLGLFLGLNAAQALSTADSITELSELSEEGFSGARKPAGIDLSFFLAHAACMIQNYGWRSRSAVQNGGLGGRCTSEQTLGNIDDQRLQQREKRSREPLWIDPSEADGALAGKVATWLASLDGRQGLNDYLSNLAQIGRNGFVTERSAGFAASAVNAYLKDQEQAQKATALVKGASSYVGKVGEKVSFERLTLVKSYGFDGDFGPSFIHRFVDESGNIVVWKTGIALDLGVYKVTGSVKAQEEFRSEKQTVITRAKTVQLEEVSA